MSDTWEERKAARRAEFLAKQGVSQPRKVFRVFARSAFGELPSRFEQKPIGVFYSRAELKEFLRETGPGTAFGSAAVKTMLKLLSCDELRKCAPGWETYVRFVVA